MKPDQADIALIKGKRRNGQETFAGTFLRPVSFVGVYTRPRNRFKNLTFAGAKIVALKLVAHASASLEMSSGVLSCGPLSRLCCMNSVSRL